MNDINIKMVTAQPINVKMAVQTIQVKMAIAQPINIKMMTQIPINVKMITAIPINVKMMSFGVYSNHAIKHQVGGNDEINLTGLEGTIDGGAWE